MRISRKWFNQFMDVQDLSIEEMAKRITDAGFEVEGIEHLSQGTNLVIGHVETCTEHPDSDHLHCTTVNVGNEFVNCVWCTQCGCRTKCNCCTTRCCFTWWRNQEWCDSWG